MCINLGNQSASGWGRLRSGLANCDFSTLWNLVPSSDTLGCFLVKTKHSIDWLVFGKKEKHNEIEVQKVNNSKDDYLVRWIFQKTWSLNKLNKIRSNDKCHSSNCCIVMGKNFGFEKKFRILVVFFNVNSMVFRTSASTISELGFLLNLWLITKSNITRRVLK